MLYLGSAAPVAAQDPAQAYPPGPVGWAQQVYSNLQQAVDDFTAGWNSFIENGGPAAFSYGSNIQQTGLQGCLSGTTDCSAPSDSSGQ